MIRFEHISVMNWENALRGMRNPLASWDKGDSGVKDGEFVLGPNDLDLAVRLCRAGGDHRKFLRQIFVSVDITAPLYWWKEYDTYKVGTVANSTSTMHKIHAKPITREDFSHDRLTPDSLRFLDVTVEYLETVRQEYLKEKDKRYWYDLIQLLPESYNQTRTCTMNYENLVNICRARKGHKLDEWHAFREEFAGKLPYAEQLIFLYENQGEAAK